MTEQYRNVIDEIACEYPIYQYEFFNTDDLVFSENVRYICRTECPMYGKSWSCPPSCGTIGECEASCRKFKNGLIFSSVAEVSDAANLAETLPTRAAHTAILKEIVKRGFSDTERLVLSCESCSHCAECTCPDGACRFPEEMLPCIEGYGIVVTALAEQLGMDFYISNDTVLWFGIILF